ncbi:MAG TPA: polyribonucleotide nucleotidyltransferase, partial [Stellaceae bacterium]|nr:polyribonucleotide nucleotidyltransferase [Stellaceae bacterium]
MFEVYRKELMWGGRRLVLETGKVARQANGAVMATYGETTVLCTAVANKQQKPGQDFFPLTVNYQEKTFAAGKIPGGFFKREGRPSEKEVLTSRLIDRPIRPLFASGFLNETQVVCTVLSHDLENDPDMVALVGASAALTISGIPFLGPIGGARVGYIDGQYVLNPKLDELPNSALELVVAGTTEGVLMVESEAKELSEDVMLGAVMFGHKSFQPVIQAIIELAEVAAKEPWAMPEKPENAATIEEKLSAAVSAEIAAAYGEQQKQARQQRLEAAKAKIPELFPDDAEKTLAGKYFKQLEKDIV